MFIACAQFANENTHVPGCATKYHVDIFSDVNIREELRLIWTAYLLHRDAYSALMPGWSDHEGFKGRWKGRLEGKEARQWSREEQWTFFSISHSALVSDQLPLISAQVSPSHSFSKQRVGPVSLHPRAHQSRNHQEKGPRAAFQCANL